MTPDNWSDEQLLAYLHNECEPGDASELEAQLRTHAILRNRLQSLQTESEMHSVGEIWRRHRLSCPTRDELEQKLHGSLTQSYSYYIDFHLEVLKCEICRANFADLQNSLGSREASVRRRKEIFQSSAGHLSPRRD